ncbi:hypothetical protein DL95DRAFT_409525 [Leptodontidium sp. 2 PMI_412]|nr:hypothetical protein DL95DRAFT_409525 [Leptodontidium sp. 2 PMI_412]
MSSPQIASTSQELPPVTLNPERNKQGSQGYLVHNILSSTRASGSKSSPSRSQHQPHPSIRTTTQSPQQVPRDTSPPSPMKKPFHPFYEPRLEPQNTWKSIAKKILSPRSKDVRDWRYGKPKNEELTTPETTRSEPTGKALKNALDGEDWVVVVVGKNDKNAWERKRNLDIGGGCISHRDSQFLQEQRD